LKVQGSVDGKNWNRLANGRKQSYIKPGDGLEDILDVTLNLTHVGNVRYVRLSFGARDPGNPLTLSECEVWESVSK
jgi:hypothetical protein